MSSRTTGLCLTFFAVLAGIQHACGLAVPVFKVPFLGGHVLGWLLVSICLACGLRLWLRKQREWQFAPQTIKQLRRFRSLRRGYLSFLVLVGLAPREIYMLQLGAIPAADGTPLRQNSAAYTLNQLLAP